MSPGIECLRCVASCGCCGRRGRGKNGGQDKLVWLRGRPKNAFRPNHKKPPAIKSQ